MCVSLYISPILWIDLFCFVIIVVIYLPLQHLDFGLVLDMPLSIPIHHRPCVCVCVCLVSSCFWFSRELHFAWFIALKCGRLHDTIFQGKVRFGVVSLTPS